MKDHFQTLKTKRLLLRPFKSNDILNVYKGLSDPEVIKYYGVSYATPEETKVQMKFFSDLEKNKTGIWWAICSADNKIFYGAAGINDIQKEHQKGEIGFWLLKEHWKKGIITEALPIILQFAFETLKLHRIEAIIENENIASKKIVEKSGFECEGIMRECEIKNGNFIDLCIYAKLNGK